LHPRDVQGKGEEAEEEEEEEEEEQQEEREEQWISPIKIEKTRPV